MSLLTLVVGITSVEKAFLIVIRMRNKFVFLIVTILIGSICYSNCVEKTDEVLKKELIEESENNPTKLSNSEKRAFAMGKCAMSFLKRVLFSNETFDDDRWTAAYQIALIGGEEARDALKSQFGKTNSSEILRLLCFAMASTGTSSDKTFLVNIIKEGMTEDERSIGAIEAAAITLGVIRYSPAVPILEEYSKENAGTVASSASKQAIRWIKSKKIRPKQIDSAPIREAVILALLSNGIPDLLNSTKYTEHENNLLWEFTATGWKFTTLYKKEENDSQIPRIAFDVFFTNDSSRCLVLTVLNFSRSNSRAYICKLGKRTEGWNVEGILDIWIT